MNKIYGIKFGKCTPSIQSVLKWVTEYEKKSKDCGCFWIMEEVKKVTAWVDKKANPRLSLIEHLISLVTMRQVPTETNNEYVESLNDILNKLILSGGEQVICSLKTMDKSDVAATPQEVNIEEEKFKAMLFLLWADESIHGKLSEDLRKVYFVGRYE